MAVVSDLIDGDVVEDPEILYRRIRSDWAVLVEGQWRLTSQAFNDRNWKPSVNRHKLLPEPAHSKVDKSDGVVQLVAVEVRGVTGLLHNPGALPHLQVTYKLDVVARPIEANKEERIAENAAHAQIESDPAVEARSRFDKIKDALSRLAEQREWPIQPVQPNPYEA